MSVWEEQDYTKRFDLGLWRKLLRFAASQKKLIFALGAVMIAVGFVDAVFPQMNRYAVDTFIVPGTTDGLLRFIAMYAGLVLIQATNVWLLITIAGKIEMRICYDIRRTGFEHLQELSFSYYDTTPVGWIMARMTSDSQRLGEAISWGLVDMIWGATMMIAIIGFMLSMNVPLALTVLSVVPLLVLASGYFQKKILEAHRRVRKTNSRISGAYNEGIMGAKTTKTLVREDANLVEFRELSGELRRSSIRTATFSALYLPIVLTLGSIGTGLALWRGGSGVVAGTLTYGTLVAFLSYTVQFFEPVRELARVLAELQSAQASAERVISMIETPAEIIDTPEVVATFGDNLAPKRENWPPVTGAIEFRDVSFQYKNGEKVLEGFSLAVNSGEAIALVGETGSGKSTIVNLACRFYEPSTGSILIDGTDYRERSLAWHHSHLGYVLQQPHLFSGTVRENIRYGRLDASDDEVIEAAKLVNAHHFIERMEGGYGAEVGEGGGLLSTGEKQLVSFARAVLANPVFFVLDEATSSIDTETELLIQDAIRVVLEGRTSFIIAHRLSTIKTADRILVISKGRIIEDGTHHELIRNKGHYYTLYTNQFLEEGEERVLSHLE